jgi:hypothetical protein
MEAVIPFILIFGFIGLMLTISLITNLSARRANQVVTTGVPAKGLVLQVSQTGVGVFINGTRYERRGMVLDVEIPGRAPYQVSANPLIPKTFVRNVLPGTFVELRIDPRRADSIAVVGPGSVFFVE